MTLTHDCESRFQLTGFLDGHEGAGGEHRILSRLLPILSGSGLPATSSQEYSGHREGTEEAGVLGAAEQGTVLIRRVGTGGNVTSDDECTIETLSRNLS